MAIALANKTKLLWIGNRPLPPNVHAAVDAGWELVAFQSDIPLSVQLSVSKIAVIHHDIATEHPVQFDKLLDELEQASAVAVILLPENAEFVRKLLSNRHGAFICIHENSSPAEIAAKIAAAFDLQPAINHLQEKLADAHDANLHGNHSKAINEEMRLAARLQRDFLPCRLPEVSPARFGVLYHPASWVSGDIYDVTRLDETHVGFYIADAVGHGMPAALLTMFIKKALQTKRIDGSTYKIIPPDVSLSELNSDICEQDFASCHFCTAVYCILDTATLELTYARAGHPAPILVHEDGSMETLSADGALLGVFPDAQFSLAKVKLQPGDRLIVYTDGAEEVLCRQSENHRVDITDALQPWTALPREEMLLDITAVITEKRGHVPKDDITLMVMDIENLTNPR